MCHTQKNFDSLELLETSWNLYFKLHWRIKVSLITFTFVSLAWPCPEYHTQVPSCQPPASTAWVSQRISAFCVEAVAAATPLPCPPCLSPALPCLSSWRLSFSVHQVKDHGVPLLSSPVPKTHRWSCGSHRQGESRDWNFLLPPPMFSLDQATIISHLNYFNSLLFDLLYPLQASRLSSTQMLSVRLLDILQWCATSQNRFQSPYKDLEGPSNYVSWLSHLCDLSSSSAGFRASFMCM